MIDILLCSIIVSLFCLGLKISTGDDMILNFVKVGLDKIFVRKFYSGYESRYDDGIKAHKLYYPILYCIKCMPSIYGTLIALLFFPFHVELIYQIPLVVFCSVTLNCIFYQMYE